MTGPEHDAELEAFLKRRSPMYRRLSDIDHAEPSLEIDRLVLNRAREAIETPRQPPMYRASRWALPVGLAATILIAFTVVLNIDRHAPDAGRPAAPSAAPAAEAPAPTVARAAPVRESAGVDQPQVLSDSADARRDQQVARKAEAPAVLAKRSEAPQRADAAGKSAASERYLASSNALASNVSVPPPPAAAAPQAPQAAAEADAGAGATAPDPHATAESWLREIKRLRAAGKTADANRELAAFRQAYPTHPAYSVAKPPAR